MSGKEIRCTSQLKFFKDGMGRRMTFLGMFGSRPDTKRRHCELTNRKKQFWYDYVGGCSEHCRSRSVSNVFLFFCFCSFITNPHGSPPLRRMTFVPDGDRLRYGCGRFGTRRLTLPPIFVCIFPGASYGTGYEKRTLVRSTDSRKNAAGRWFDLSRT